MKSRLTFLIILTCLVRLSFSQTIEGDGRLAYYITPQMSTLVNKASSGNNAFGFGFECALLYKIPLSSLSTFVVGPSIHAAEVKNRVNELQWPSDVIDGQWVPGLSYEEYKATFVSFGAAAGLNLIFPRSNQRWMLSGGTNARYVVSFKDKLVLNESGNIRDYTTEELITEINKLQIMVDVGLSYSINLSPTSTLSFGPVLSYGLVEFLASAEPTLVWEYQSAHPVFYGLRVMMH